MTKTRTKKKTKPAPAPEPKVWRLPYTYTAGQLVTVAKLIQKEPDTRYVIPDGPGEYWTRREVSGQWWMNWFGEKLTEKINAAIPNLYGRKS